MKIAMVYPNRLWNNVTGYQLGLAMLTTILQQAGHDARYFVYYGKQDMQALKDFDPDLLGYYYVEFQTTTIKEIIDEFPTKYHLAGGPYPTLNPECVREIGLNAIFRGEADHALLKFVESGLKDTTIPGFVFRDKANPLGPQLTGAELDKLPVLNREPYTSKLLQFDRIKRWESKHKGAIHFAAGRGCPYSCKFCANNIYNKLWKPAMRYRSPALLIQEIIAVSEQYTFGSVVFADDIVTLDKDWFNEFIDLYINNVKDKTLILNTRVDCITQEQMHQLKAAKCVLLRAGIESGSKKVRELMGRPMDSNDIYKVFCQMIDAGLRTYSYNLIGYPGETIEDWEETFALNAEIDLYASKKKQRHLGMVNVFYPYIGTVIGDECYAKGWVDTSRLEAAHPHSDYILKTPYITEEQIQQACCKWPFNHGG